MAQARAWYRRSNESLQAYEAFTTYLTLGPDRSLDRVSQTLAKSLPLMKRWSAKYDWMARVAAYEEQFALRVLDETEDERIKLMKEHMDFAGLLLRKARARLVVLADEVSDDPVAQAVGEKTGVYPTVDQALRAGDLAVKVGRLAAGIDGKYAPSTPGSTDVSQLTDEDLDKLEALLDKAKGQ